MYRQAQLSGTFAHLGPFLAVLSFAALGQEHVLASDTRFWELFVIGTAASLGGLWYRRRSGLGAVIVTAALGGFIWFNLPALSASPLLALTYGLLAAIVVSLAWGVRQRRPVGDGRRANLARIRASAGAALGIWFLVVVAGFSEGFPAMLLLLTGFGPTVFLALLWLARERRPSSRRRLVGIAAVSLLFALLLLPWSPGREVLLALPALAAAGLLFAVQSKRLELRSSTWADLIVARPARLLVATFAALILTGSLFLTLPFSSSSGVSLNPFDAAFTAVSAVCVTGLIVLDTPGDFSAAGQVAILLMIQLGGLGIMTFSAAALGLLGRRLRLRYEGSLAGLMSGDDRSTLFRALKLLLTVTFVAEAVGAGLLAIFFSMNGDGIGMALWRGVFTSISAFCNAGFALQSDNLIGYHDNPMILHVVAALIVLGGLSPATAVALPDWLRRRPVSLQVRLSLVATALLLVSGTLAIAAFEWTGTLAQMSLLDRFHNAWFQSVTLRTAGFNSIDIAQIQPATLTLMLIWMFIGGCPAGTAGGIKTTTTAVLLLAVVGAIQGRAEVIAYGRRISQSTLYKAAAVGTVGVVAVGLATVAMQLTQDMPNRVALFEVVSALGTVGLSMGGTPQLDRVGELIIMGCMFLGRVGPLTMLVFLAARRPPHSWGLPEGRVEVG